MAATDNKFTFKDGISLKEYFDECLKMREANVDTRFESQDAYNTQQEKALAIALSAQEKALGAALASQEKALGIALMALDKRLEGINESIGIIGNKTNTSVTREMYDTRSALMQKQIDELMLSKASLEGKASQSSINIIYFVSSASLAVAVIGIVIRLIGF